MSDHAIPLVMISGPVGVGKTSVGNEVSEQLIKLGIAHTFIDIDVLAQTFPRPGDDPFGSRLANENLASVWRNCAKAGSLNLIIAQVMETQREVGALERAIPGSEAVVFQLRASEAVLRERVGKREIGSGHDWHVARALELARSLALAGPADHVIETDGRQVSEIAMEIVEHVRWQRSD